MTKPFSIGLYSSMVSGADRIGTLSDLPGVIETWQRSKRWEGGDNVGDFSLDPDTPVWLLQQYFDEWLGLDVKEWATTHSWHGMIYEMEFDDGQVKHTRSLGWLRNRVVAAFDEGIKNGGFEILAAAPPTDQPFDDWSKFGTKGAASITADATSKATGARSLRIENTAAETTTGLACYQTVTGLVEDTLYELSFSTRGDGTNSQKFKIRNVTTNLPLVDGFSGIVRSDWSRHTVEVMCPVGCTSFQIEFWASDGVIHNTYVDDVSLKRKGDGRIAKHETAIAEDSGSQRIYGTREQYVDAQIGPLARAEALRDRALALGAWPEARESGKGSGRPSLTVACVGYSKTLEWSFTDYTTVLAEISEQGAYVTDLLALAGEFVAAGLVDVPADVTAYDQQSRRNLWQVISREVLPRLGGWYRFWIDLQSNDHRPLVFLFNVSNEPAYYLKDGVFYDSNWNAVPARLVEPGIVRNMREKPRQAPSSSAYLDQRDFTLSEVSVNPAGKIGWSIQDIAADIIDPVRAQAAYAPANNEIVGGISIKDKAI